MHILNFQPLIPKGDKGKMTEPSPASWSDIEPQLGFLKRVLQRKGRSYIESMFGKKIPLKIFDPFMINEAVEYLNVSIVNLLAYKRLMCGNYFAWGKVTIYYSQFYAINSLLRLRRYALVHLKFYGEKEPLIIKIQKPREGMYYLVGKCGARGHDNAWGMFAQKYPEFAPKNRELAESLGRYSINEREDWNYDLFYASQNNGKYILREAKERCENNFLDPDYDAKHSGSEDEAEYYGELMAQTGFEEAGTGQYQKLAIDTIVSIAKTSKYWNWYVAHLADVLESVNKLDSAEEMKREMTKWLSEGIEQIKQGKA